MQLDVRLPIGMMFGIVGILLAIYGLSSDPAIYQRSLGININLYWGVVLFAFGAFMLALSWRSKPTDGNSTPPAGTGSGSDSTHGRGSAH
jgi:hypothetical protein